MFVALEGADGCGKTTLCTVLARRLGATAYSTPPKRYLESRDKVDRESSALEHYRFYREGIYDASSEIDEILGRGESVVSDRYWLSTFTYHQVMGVPVSREDFSCVVQPMLTVVLSLNHKVQMERMTIRGMSIGDRRMLDRQQDLTKAFYQNVLELSVPFIFIDAQFFSPEKCASIIMEAIKI